MVDPYEQVVTFLPSKLRGSALSLPQDKQRDAEEIRLRAGGKLQIASSGREYAPPMETIVLPEDLQNVLEIACEHSIHTALDRMRGGYITVRGGHRIGICGEVITEQGKITGFRRPSSLNIRIAREIKGAAKGLSAQLMLGDSLESTLIIAPPGAGKTTLLRDLIRSVSEGECGKSFRVGVVDERGELASLWGGTPQLELGPRTDILDGAPKAEGMLFLLRGMTPQVLAVDEITHPEDIRAVVQASGCGTTVLATIHGRSQREIQKRPVYRELAAAQIFTRAVLFERGSAGERLWNVEEIIC